MRKNPFYALDDQEVVRRLVRENPGDAVGASSAGLVASHYPILLEEDREELPIVTPPGLPDEGVHELGEHELLVISQGPHGTFVELVRGARRGTHLELHHRPPLGRPQILSPEANFEVLHRLVDHFEEPVAQPRPLDGTPRTRRTPSETVVARSGCGSRRRGSSRSGR